MVTSYGKQGEKGHKEEVAVPVTQKDLAEMGAACEGCSAGKVG